MRLTHRMDVTGTTENGITRRDFVQGAAGLGTATTLLSGLTGAAAFAADGGGKATKKSTVAIAEWSYFWLGVKRAGLARGTVASGAQMYVEYQVPAQLRHPYPVVLVHGGGGQGTDWMGTPDGRPGWQQLLLQEGYAVYVVDRPGHGRSPYHPDLHGGFPPTAAAMEFFEGRFTPPSPATLEPNPLQLKHTQWPGAGTVGSADLDQFVASQGGAYVQPAGGAPAAAPGGRSSVQQTRAAQSNADRPANAVPPTPAGAATALAHGVWRERGAELLDRIGPAIIVSHSAAGAFGWLVADARPDLVKAIVSIEGGGTPFTGANRWGISTIPMSYDPPAKDAAQLATRRVEAPEAGVGAYFLQAEPARRLKNLQNIPIAIVTAEASFASPGNPGLAAFFRQAGCQAEELRLAANGLHGNGHMMMVEKNNREVLQTVLGWLGKHVTGLNAGGAAVTAGTTSGAGTSLQLAEQGLFWVGTRHKSLPYGTIEQGQMYVQYLVPAVLRHPVPIVLVHGGTGQMLHYMGAGGGAAGWAHYYLQAGYKVYLVDRPGHGRSPYHPDALGPIGAQPTYEQIMPDMKRSATAPEHRWPGTGELDDPLVDQFMASQNASMQDLAAQHALWASRGAELLDRIGPAIIQTHSAGGSFGWLAADQRPDLVRAIVVYEGGGQPFGAQTPWGMTAAPLAYDPPAADAKQLLTREVPGDAPYRLQAEPVRKLKNLQKIPTLYLTAPSSGRTGGPGVVAYLQQAGVPAEHLNLAERGIRGNGHFSMIENNNKEVFEVLRNWIEQKVPAAIRST
jgi:pimeloyl-ACP methyl ester carboxylesterase